MNPLDQVTVLKEKNPAWWSDIRDICCATGNAGNPIDKVRWDFFSEQWVGPYQKILPGWTYVVLSGESVVGYLTGCPNTRRFAMFKKIFFDFVLVLKIIFGRFQSNNDTKRFLRRFFRIEQGPEDSFAPETLLHVYKRYPAHLHMNLLSTARGKGAGRQLINAFAKDLQERKITGIHLFCGEEARKFYLKMGFTDIAQVEFRPHVNVYLMGMLLV